MTGGVNEKEFIDELIFCLEQEDIVKSKALLQFASDANISPVTQIRALQELAKSPENVVFPLLEYLIITKSWWDTVDGLAAWMAGELFQLKYKKDTNLDLLFGFIGKLSGHKSFRIRKAIGWSLREYSKTDPQTVL